MGRILFTNNEKWGKELKDIFDCYFTSSFVDNNQKAFVANYKKLNLDNENYYLSERNYCICVGTLIYKAKFGKEALKELLLDSETYSIKDLRKNAIGSYAVVIKNAKKYLVFADETHTYFLYYYDDGKQFIFSNSCWHIAHVIGASINEAPLLEMGVRRCIISDQTPYKKIKKLCAAEYFEMNLATGQTNISKTELNNYKQSFSTKRQAIEYIVENIKEVSEIRSRFINKYLHFLTGGIDSRLELAVNSYNKDNMHLGYWMGNDLITNGTKEDAQIVSNIGDACHYPYTIFDVSEDFHKALSNITAQKCMKYGEYASIYGGNSKWFSIFESIHGIESVGFGYLGELMRPLGELDNNYKKPFSSLDFIKKVYCRCGLEKEMFQLEGFYTFIQNEIEPLIRLNNGNENNLTKDIAFKLFSYSRFEADCFLSNFGNTFVYSFPILGCKKIADAIFSLKYEWLKDDYISIGIIEKFSPRLLEYPIYSHHRAFSYNKNNSTMVETWKYRFLDNMKNIFKDTFVYRILYLKYAHKFIRPQSTKNDEIMKECSKIMDKLSLLKRTDFKVGDLSSWKGGDIGSIATFIGDLLVIYNQNYFK